jgi:protein-disulfide isomerase
MASRKEQKEAARQRRIAEEQARAARERRERRLRMLAGTMIGAVAVVAVAIAISSGGSSGGGLQKGKALQQTEAAVSGLLNGVPQSGNTLGKTTAPVTISYYGDLECPICKDFTLTSFPSLVQNEVRQGKVKVVYKSVCTATCNSHPQTTFTTQQVAALAAGKQNKFWNYIELFYHEQGSETSGYVNDTYLSGLAGQVPGLDVSAWKSARSDPSLSSQVTGDESAAAAQSIQSTPTLIVQGPKGKAQPSQPVPTYSELQQLVKQVS